MQYAIGIPLWLVLAGFVVWMIVDASARPDWVWERTGQNKMVWIVVPLVALIPCGLVSLIMVIVYFASIRPKLEQAQGIT